MNSDGILRATYGLLKNYSFGYWNLERFNISSFLAACHGIVENTLIFAQVGACWRGVFGARVLSAFITTIIASKTKYLRVEEISAE